MTLMRTFMVMPFLLVSAVAGLAQSERADKSAAPPDPTVTVSVSPKGLRFLAPGSLGQMRLEVFNARGDSLYNSEFQPGNVRDWALDDKLGQPLADGSYLCVVTVRDLSGKLSLKQGSVLIQGSQPSLKLGEGEQAGSLVPEKVLAPLPDANAIAVALMAHDGKDGQVVNTRGDLTFRAGDFFAGLDRELMRLTPDGNLGLGVATPRARLDVAGAIRTSDGIVFPDGTIQSTAAIAGPTSPEPIPTPGQPAKPPKQGKGSGNSGKGDDVLSPQFNVNEDLVINGHIIFTPGTFRDVTMQNNAGGLRLYGAPSPLTVSPAAAAIQFWGNSSVFPGQLYLDSGAHNSAAVIVRTTGNGGTITERMRVTSTGNVGIGTTSPQAKLDVAGDMQVAGNAVIAGNIAAKYQDVAEWVPAREKLGAGTVVSLDVTRNNAVVASARAYDTQVAGVVSPQPGVILGEGGEGKVMVATTGRLKVKVDATRRPIKIGDLLVTSGKTGMAMKSQPIRVGGVLIHRPGTIIGKALEPLARGRGEILVLLSLQ